MEIQFAEKNRAGFFQTDDNFRIFGRNPVFEDAARCGRPDAGRIDVVLQGDGNAVERPAPLAALLFGFHFACRRERLLSRDRDERVDRGVEPIDSLEARLSEIDRRCTSPSKKIGSLFDGQSGEIRRLTKGRHRRPCSRPEARRDEFSPGATREWGHVMK